MPPDAVLYRSTGDSHRTAVASAARCRVWAGRARPGPGPVPSTRPRPTMPTTRRPGSRHRPAGPRRSPPGPAPRRSGRQGGPSRHPRRCLLAARPPGSRMAAAPPNRAAGCAGRVDRPAAAPRAVRPPRGHPRPGDAGRAAPTTRPRSVPSRPDPRHPGRGRPRAEPNPGTSDTRGTRSTGSTPLDGRGPAAQAAIPRNIAEQFRDPRKFRVEHLHGTGSKERL